MEDKKGMEINKMLKDTEEEPGQDEAYIKAVFGHDDLEVPESLSRENIASMLAAASGSAAEQEPGNRSDGHGSDLPEEAPEASVTVPDSGRAEKRPAVKHVWRRTLGWAAAIAACFMLAVMPVLRAGTTGTADLTAFSSYDEIYKKIDEIQEESRRGFDGKYMLESESVEDAVGISEERAAMNGATAKSLPENGSGEGHSDTYLQVKGVDEADRVKVDGEYIYFIDSTASRVRICSASKGKTVKLSTIYASENGSLEAIFLAGSRLTLIESTYGEQGDDTTSAVVYDVSSRTSPKKVSEYVQSGIPVSQRMVGDILYLVTDQYVYGRNIPYSGEDGKTSELKAEDICCVPYPANPEYTVIGAYDTSSGKELSHVTKAVLGGSQDIYSNGENLYVAGTSYAVRKSGSGMIRDYFRSYIPGEAKTMVIKVRLANGSISIQDSAVVKGTIDDQFSMDEKDGNFRIATTSISKNGSQMNNLFVLDEDLEELGHVSGFAKGESIRAVRYVKDKAYVITYEETDPLFVIDLSDSKEPKIEGEVKIDGFSTMLVPLSDDRLLGIGYATKQVEDWQETSGLKFALFDISDPAEPKVVTSKEMESIYSEVQVDHRALVMLGEGEKARFILPCWKSYEEYADGDPTGGVLTMTAKDDRIDVLSYDGVENAVERCPVIGDYIYAICDTDDIVAVKMVK